jgi:hypothetical protein
MGKFNYHSVMMYRRALLPLTVLNIFISSCGVEKSLNQDVRATVNALAASKNSSEYAAYAVFKREISKFSGDVVILMGYPFDKELERLNLTNEQFIVSPLGESFAKSHIFKASQLTTGKTMTLDGKLHDVKCESSSGICTVDDRISGGADRIDVFYTGGKIYAMNGFLTY